MLVRLAQQRGALAINQGSPTVTLLENKTTTFCDNFQLSGQDYTQLKYYITGANSDFQLGAFTAPKLIDLPNENIICSLLDLSTGNCTRTQECWCEEISPGEYHLTYNKTADADTSNYTVVMRWSGRGANILFSDPYTFHEVSTVIDPNSVQIASSSSKVNLCDNNNQVQVTCEISRDHVSPSPTFSFSVDGPRSQGPQPGTDSSDGNYYQSRFSLSPDVGGQYQVTCRVTNTVTNTWQDKSTQITFNKPPPGPPQVTVVVQTYRGISPSNIVTLAEGYTGDVTCRVEGGYPGAHTTQLKCGQLENTGDGNTTTVRFTTDTLTRDLDGTVCTCTSQHDSGCYNNRETRYTLNVLCAQQFSPLFSPSSKYNGVLGETAEIDIEIYGFPILQRTVDNANLTSSPRHEVKYTSSVAPFGFVNVTISDLVKADYTNYTLTIDNGVGDALVYSFYLNKDALEVTFTKSSPSTEFNKGDNLDLTCSAQGNPDPTSVTLTRERNDEIITRVQAAEMTYTLDSLDCLDTGVYVCSGQNSQGTTSKEISISVN
ncbi:neural cell adhesion molecule 1-like, partial [Elysia marginata]